MPVFELHAGPALGLGDEADLDLAGLVGIALHLPARADVPAEDDPVRRLVGQHAGPTALAAVDAAVDDVAAHTWLEHGLGDVGAEDVVLARLETAKALGERRERPLDRRLHDDVVADRRCCWCGHESSSSV